MLKQVVAIVLMLAFALQTFNRAILMFDYAANTGQYSKNCVNKTRPKMNCNGQCILMKKMQQEEKKDQQNPDRKAENKNEIVQLFKSPGDIIVFSALQTEHAYTGSIDAKEIKMPRSIFRPPVA